MRKLLILRHSSSLRSVSEQEILDALSQEELALPRRIAVLDASEFEHDIESGGWDTSVHYLRDRARELRNSADSFEATEVLHFGIAEVPLLLGLGAMFGDERLIEGRDYDRDSNRWTWPEAEKTIHMVATGTPNEEVGVSGQAVIRVEVSGTVVESDVMSVVEGDLLANVLISPAEPRSPERGIVRSYADVLEVRKTFRTALYALLAKRPRLTLIHLFVAGPPSVCIAIGQEIRVRNDCAVQLYRHRKTEVDDILKPAFLLSSFTSAGERGLTNEERSNAEQMRSRVWPDALESVKAYAKQKAQAHATDCSWFEYLQPSELLRTIRPFGELKPIWDVVGDGDQVASAPHAESYGFDKDSRQWRLSNILLSRLYDAAEGDVLRIQQLVRLFLFHEYLHDWQTLTKYTALEVGRFANCLERIDYIADTFALLHQYDFVSSQQMLQDDRVKIDFVADQIGLLLKSLWAFEQDAVPDVRWQERRIRRYLNWFWKRVQVKRSATFESAIASLLTQPFIEISGLQYVTVGGRVFLLLDRVRVGSHLEIGLVQDNGQFWRTSSVGALSIEQAVRAFQQHDHEALVLFFNTLYEMVPEADRRTSA